MTSRVSPSPALLPILLLSLIAWSLPAALAQDEAAPVVVTPEKVLTLGPLPLPAPSGLALESAMEAEFVPELDPLTLRPRAGQAVSWGPGASAIWTSVPSPEGIAPLPESSGRGVVWAAVYLEGDRYAPITLRVRAEGDLRLFVDGEERARGVEAAGSATELSATLDLPRGQHRLLLRVERGAARAGGLLISARAAGGAGLGFRDDAEHVVTDYDELRRMVTYSDLALSPDGRLLAVVRSVRDPEGEGRRRWLDVLTVDTRRRLASGLGGDGAVGPIWRPDGRALLFRQGESLWVWERETGVLRQVLRDEPGLGRVRWLPDGRSLVFASTRGAPAPPEGDGPRRKTELREKLADWPTAPHLWLLATDSGARRRLTVPGDWVHDAFEPLPGGRALFYFRSVPIGERPWFVSEARLLDLETGEDSLVRTLRMGFEYRPGQGSVRVSPDGSRVALIAPTAELGLGEEPSAFDPDLWVLDLESGVLNNVTSGMKGQADGPVWWSHEGDAVRFLGTRGSRHSLFEAKRPWAPDARIEEWPLPLERIDSVSLVPRASNIALAGSDTDRLPTLMTVRGREVAGAMVLDDGNQQLQSEWTFEPPEDASFTNAEGQEIEAWLYRPAGPAAPTEGEKAPLIVYYYGGATPVRRGFNGLHQYLAAHGYAVWVVTPRGAGGYGKDFSIHHVNDWGRKAGSDILEGLEKLLAKEAWLDPERVGCYGGSYGGFMTFSLLTRTDRFAAAVSLFGIANLASYWGDGMWGWTYGDQALARSYPWNARDVMVELSPLFHAEKIKTPLLMLHGGADVNVPPGESEQMFTALRILGVPAELVRFPGEDHGISGRWENRAGYRTMMLEWFDRWLRDQPEAWEARWD